MDERKPIEPPYWLKVSDESWGPTEIPKRKAQPILRRRRRGGWPVLGLVFWTQILLMLAVVFLYLAGAVMKLFGN